MLVRAKRTHFTHTLRKEDDEWEHSGKLYEHIEPVKAAKSKPAEEPKPVEEPAATEEMKQEDETGDAGE